MRLKHLSKAHQKTWQSYVQRCRVRGLDPDESLKDDLDAMDSCHRTPNRVATTSQCQYLEDARRRKLVKRECQGCAERDRSKLRWHHIHTKKPAVVCWVLCHNCNTALGQFMDNLELMMLIGRVLQSLTPGDVGINRYDPVFDGPVYIPPLHYLCDICQRAVRRRNAAGHELGPEHVANRDAMSAPA